MAILVGLTGGMGSGKSTVAKMFRTLGAYIIDADQVCRELVQPGKPALKEIQSAFGESVLTPEGELDRKQMASLIFDDPDKKRVLERILHPRVFEEEKKVFEEIRKTEPEAVVIIDAALLIESGNYRKVDKVVLVRCDENRQIERLTAKGQFSPDDAKKRIKTQMSQDEKAGYSDYILENNSSLDELSAKVETLYSQLLNTGNEMTV